jgi:hypothetical protein
VHGEAAVAVNVALPLSVLVGDGAAAAGFELPRIRVIAGAGVAIRIVAAGTAERSVRRIDPTFTRCARIERRLTARLLPRIIPNGDALPGADDVDRIVAVARGLSVTALALGLLGRAVRAVTPLRATIARTSHDGWTGELPTAATSSRCDDDRFIRFVWAEVGATPVHVTDVVLMGNAAATSAHD